MMTCDMCPGSYCTCSGRAILKDGHVARLIMRDSASGSSPVRLTFADTAKSTKYDNVRDVIIGGMPAAEYFAALDAAPDHTARREAYQDHYEQRIRDA